MQGVKKYNVLIIVILSLLCVIAIFFFTKNQLEPSRNYTNTDLIGNEQTQGMTLDEAVALAKQKVNGTVKEVNNVTKNGVDLYEIQIEQEDNVYVLYVDKANGIVQDQVFVEEKTQAEQNVDTPKTDVPSNETDNQTQENSSTIQPQPTPDRELTLEEAERIALNEINGTIIQAEEDYDDGELYYEFKISTGMKVYEVEIHAGSGLITEFKLDD